MTEPWATCSSLPAKVFDRLDGCGRLVYAELVADLSDQVRELLGARNMAHVATLMPDGAPHVSPVWISVEGEHLAIFSARENLKIRNLRRDGRVGVSVCDEHNPYRSVVIRGRVIRQIEGEEAIAIMDRMSNRYVGSNFPIRSAIVSLIQPERVRTQDLPFEHPSEDPQRHSGPL